LCCVGPRSALHWAAHEGRKDCVEELLDKGADANMQGEYSVSPLHCAANAGQVDCMKMLLENGAQLNICDDDNQTPLHYVSEPPCTGLG
jgi:ankyrin repeat protein